MTAEDGQVCNGCSAASGDKSVSDDNRNISNNNNNSDNDNDNVNGILDKEPPLRCHLCSRPIGERFFLRVGDLSCHGDCLRCDACGDGMEGEDRCYCRDGRLYCRGDYFRLFSDQQPSCGRCRRRLMPSDLVMRARGLRFHTGCFTCRQCHRAFSPGDCFGMDEGGEVYCHLHLRPPKAQEQQQQQQQQPPQQSQEPVSRSKGRPRKPKSSQGAVKKPNTIRQPRQDHLSRERRHRSPPVQVLDSCDTQSQLTTSSAPMAAESDTNSPASSGQLHRPQQHQQQHQHQHQRQKRVRTSFKHHQLRTMRAYFQVNHNPDAKDLKNLAQKTGLSKRVLQVWFQNARAKYRRSLMKQQPCLSDAAVLSAAGDRQQTMPATPELPDGQSDRSSTLSTPAAAAAAVTAHAAQDVNCSA